MDALAKLHWVSRYMTTDQWQKYIESENYMWARARIEGYRGANMDRLVASGTRRINEAWEIALDMSFKIVGEEIDALPEGVETPPLAQLVQEFAEQLMREQYLVPPTYSKRIVCDVCGPMMAPNGYPTETATCPWCVK